MKKIGLMLLFLSVILYSEEKSSGLPWPVKKEVEKTFSVYADERARGAFLLSQIRNSKSVSFLLRLLDDEFPTWCRYNSHGIWTTPAKMARDTIIKIGLPSLNYIFEVLEGTHPYVKLNKYNEKNILYILKKITGKDFNTKEDWINWWKNRS